MRMRPIIFAAAALAICAGSATAEVTSVEENGMLAVVHRTPLNLDASFDTEMVTVMVSPGGPEAEEFARRVACGDGQVMGLDRSRGEGTNWNFAVLCGAFN